MLEKLFPKNRGYYSVPSTPNKIIKQNTKSNIKNDKQMNMIIEEEKNKPIQIDELLDFFKRKIIAEEKFKSFSSLKELTEIIKLNDIKEEYIYHYLKLIDSCENMLKFKTLKLGLSNKHFKELYKNEIYDNQKEKFLQDLKEICNIEKNLDIYAIC